MTRLTWDDSPFDAGVDRGVFYPQGGPAEVWNGLTSVVESPFDDRSSIRHIDGVRRRRPQRASEFAGTIEALSYPLSLYDFLITGWNRRPFGLSYRVMNEKSYKIHLVYNILIKPASVSYAQEDNVATFSWDFTTKPVPVPESRPTSHVIIDVTNSNTQAIEALEAVLYGDETTIPSLPLPLDLFNIFEENSILRVIDHGDGSFTVTGPDSAIQMLDLTTFQITWPTAIPLDSESYSIRSL